MIELLLQAEQALGFGRIDEAERLYGRTLAADPRNAIAVVGLARVALERGDERRTYALARRALQIDPANASADRLERRIAEVILTRGQALPTDTEVAAVQILASPELAATPVAAPVPTPPVAQPAAPVPAPPVAQPAAPVPAPPVALPAAPPPTSPPAPATGTPPPPARRPGILGRILKRR